MPLDLGEARRVGKEERVNQRQLYKSRIGVIEAEGNPFPLNVDTAKLGQLGPGIPLYFALARRLHCLVGVCCVLHCFVAFRYWTVPARETYEDFGYTWDSQKGAVEYGTNLDEWRNGWYVGGCGTGFAKLWPENISNDRQLMNRWTMFDRVTAASRGPWRGRRELKFDRSGRPPGRECPPLNLTGRKRNHQADGGYDDPFGIYRQCGRNGGMPWYWLPDPYLTPDANCSEVLCGHAIYSDNDTDAWILAPYGHLGYQHPHSFESDFQYVMPQCEEVRGDRWFNQERKAAEGRLVPTTILATSGTAPNHRGRLPDEIEWMLVNPSVRITRADEAELGIPRALSDLSCNADGSGIPAVQCIDVMLPCEGCQSSVLWVIVKDFVGKKGDMPLAPVDVDILLVSFLCICIMCVAPPVMAYREARKTRAALEERTIRASSYSVYVDGLAWSLDESDERELIKYLQQILDTRHPLHWRAFPERGAHHIVKVTFVFRLGRLINLISREKRSEEMRARQEMIAQDMEEEVASMTQQCQGLQLFQHPSTFMRLFRATRELRKARKREKWYENDRNLCLERLGEERKKLKVTGAIVTFEHPIAAQRAVTAFSVGLGFLGGRGVAAPGLFHGRRLQVLEAPEPSDIIWKNFGERHAKVLALKFVAMLTLLAVMVVMCVGVYFLTSLKRSAALSGQKWLHRAMGPAIVVTDILLREVVAKGVEMEMPRSVASASVSAMWKHTGTAIFNSALACLFVHAEQDDFARTCEVNWYLDGNLLDNAESICISAMFATPFLLLFSPWGNNPVKSRFLLYMVDPKRSTRTQRELNELASGVEYRLAYRYATLIKTVFLCFLYAPLSPFILFTGLGSLILQYWADKICLLRTAQRPPWQDVNLGKHASFAIPIVLIPMPLFTVYLLRGTKPSNFFAWLAPCIPWAAEWDSDVSFMRYFTIRFYLSSAAIATVVPVAIYGGVKSMRKFMWVFMRVMAVVMVFTFRSLAFLLTCGRYCNKPTNYQRLTEFLTEAPQAVSISYYDAQHCLTTKYHTCNPVYTVLSDDVNPETIPVPECDRTANTSCMAHQLSLRQALDSLVSECLSVHSMELEQSDSFLPSSWKGFPAERYRPSEPRKPGLVELMPVPRRAG